MGESADSLPTLKACLESLLDKVELSKYVAVAAESASPSAPSTTLMHVRFLENEANVRSLAQYLWLCAQNYALSRRKRRELRQQMLDAPPDDISVAGLMTTAVRDAFLEFNKKWPHRSGEVGEVLAYCIAVEQLEAAQLAAKMSLKTNNNMPVHGLDGIHGKVEKGHLTLFFLESKLSTSANAGAKEFACSVADFTNNNKQYLREYSIVKELGNLDVLAEADRKIALDYFDVLASPDKVPKRERYVGVIIYSDDQAFKGLPPISDDQEPGFHEKAFAASYMKKLQAHQDTAAKHLADNKADVNKCRVYFIAVPDKDVLRTLFYDALGIVPVKEAKKPAKVSKPCGGTA